MVLKWLQEGLNQTLAGRAELAPWLLNRFFYVPLWEKKRDRKFERRVKVSVESLDKIKI